MESSTTSMRPWMTGGLFPWHRCQRRSDATMQRCNNVGPRHRPSLPSTRPARSPCSAPLRASPSHPRGTQGRTPSPSWGTRTTWRRRAITPGCSQLQTPRSRPRPLAVLGCFGPFGRSAGSLRTYDLRRSMLGTLRWTPRIKSYQNDQMRVGSGNA